MRMRVNDKMHRVVLFWIKKIPSITRLICDSALSQFHPRTFPSTTYSFHRNHDSLYPFSFFLSSFLLRINKFPFFFVVAGRSLRDAHCIPIREMRLWGYKLQAIWPCHSALTAVHSQTTVVLSACSQKN